MSEKYQGSAFTGAVGLMSFLSILFVWLKMTGEVDWSWILVFSPVWIGFILLFLIMVGVFTFAPNDDME